MIFLKDFKNRKKDYDSVFNCLQRHFNEKKREVYEMGLLKSGFQDKKTISQDEILSHPKEIFTKNTDYDLTLELGIDAIKDERSNDYITLGSPESIQKVDIERLNSNDETCQILQNDSFKPHELQNDCTKPHQISQIVVTNSSNQIMLDIGNPLQLITKDLVKSIYNDFAHSVHEKNLLNISETVKSFSSQPQEVFQKTKEELPSIQISSPAPSIVQSTTKNQLTDAYKTFSFAKSKPVPIVKHVDPVDKITNINPQNDKALMEYDYIITWYQTFQKQFVNPINDSPSSLDKRFRVEMKRIINMTVNAMSAHSASHLIDKWDKLKRLLAGQSVKLMGKEYNPAACSLGPLAASHYIEDCVAAAIVGQGIKQVESNPKAAFFIAPIAVALASQFPHLQLVFMAHFYSKTALLVPLFEKNLVGAQSNPAAQGKEGPDGELNEVDRLRTLKGTLQLYIAVLLTQVPAPLAKTVNNQSNISALAWFGNPGRLWTLTARCINAIPQPDQLLGAEEESIRAIERLSSCLDVLVDVIALGASTLVKFYGPTQTGKLLASVSQIARAFSSLLDKGTALPATLMAHLPSHTNMVISKLNIFLESCFTSRNRSNPTLSHNVPEPPGLLPPEFWGFN